MHDLKEQTIVITGASSGIGREATLGLARQGARLILVVRDRGRGEAIAEAARAAGAPKVELVLADLSRQSEVRRAAEEILALAPRIDVLVNNAGALFAKYSEGRRDRGDLRAEPHRVLPPHQPAPRPPQGLGARAHRERRLGLSLIHI